MRLQNYAKLTAILRLQSGLHIGTGEKPERGEPLPILESLRNAMPYIPGSSLKGKMRYLLELAYERKETDPKDEGSPCWCGKCQICLLFGSGNTATTYEPSRLIFRDCYLTDSSISLLEKIGLEEKPGIRIDRKMGTVAKGALFPMKRVPEGSEFNMEISIRIFSGDDKEAIKKWISMGLYLIEHDTIGGSGTRGSGYIKFDNIQFDGKEFDKEWREKIEEEKDVLSGIHIKKS